MSILNQASDGLFSVLIVLVRTIVHFGPMEREKLVRTCGGAVKDFDTGHLTRTLNRWTELGLFGEDNGFVVIAEPYRAALGKNADDAEVRLPRVARTVAMMPLNNMRFWESEESKSSDLSRAVAWMLAQDVYALDASPDRLAELEGRQLVEGGALKIVQNNTRWNGLKAWMHYLGFARDGLQWAVDPTDAIRGILNDIFDTNCELTGPAFVERAAAVLPVLDGGVYRTQVEAVLKERSWPQLSERCLSTSLSRAIQRLDREGSITVVKRSDNEGVVTLTGANMRPWRVVSHVLFPQAGKAT